MSIADVSETVDRPTAGWQRWNSCVICRWH